MSISDRNIMVFDLTESGRETRLTIASGGGDGCIMAQITGRSSVV